MRIRLGGGQTALEWIGTGAVVLVCIGAAVSVLLILVGLAPGPGCSGCLQPGPTPPASPVGVVIPPSGPVAGSQHEAKQFARRLVTQVTLPGGVRSVASPPAEMQVPPTFGWVPFDGVTGACAVWRVPLTLAQAVTFFTQHPPVGLRLTLTDSTGRVSGPIAGTVNTVLEFSGAPLPSGIGEAQVLLSLHADGAAATFARADAQVSWYPARSTDEYIGGLHEMTISGPHGNRTFTAPAVIAKVAALLNALQATPAEVPLPPGNCGEQNYSYEVGLSVKQGGEAWANVYLGCQSAQIDIDGEGQPTLFDPGNKVESYVASLMS
jgi:hypothetical protein